MKLWGLWVVVCLASAACSEPAAVEMMDLISPPADDLSTLADMSQQPSDLLIPSDLLPPVVPPAAVWWSTGGGASTGTATSLHGGFSIGGQWVSGRSSATSGAVLTFGYFSSSNL